MSQSRVTDIDLLDQFAGITGLGWTVSMLGYLSAILGYGTTLVTRLAVDPQLLLYFAGVCFVTTLGLDRLKTVLSNHDE
ncbi:hypothetical protein [Halovenus marina]|uniref:hypothetical protein n=1 Tax=Halovenus marina TaxID=3396621 RepID=UPI003F54C116